MAGLLVSAGAATALPELLGPAMSYGATDCSFCHVTPEGGHGNNERGLWLLAEQEKRQASSIDVAWLSARETLTVAPATASAAPVAKVAPTALPALVSLPADSMRPLDYTTRQGDWPAYAGDLRATKFSPLNQITLANVSQVVPAWTWEAFDNKRYLGGKGGGMEQKKTPDPFKATPIMAGNRLFVRTSFSAVAALNPVSGEVLWTFDPGTGDGDRPPMFGFSSRGLVYYAHETGDRVILLTSDGWMMALDVVTGQPVGSFGDAGRVDMTQGLRRPLRRHTTTWNYPPALCGDVLVVGNQTSDGSHRIRGDSPWNENLPLGDVRGFDAVTGRQLWVFKTVPQAGEPGVETWGNESWRWMGNTNVWSMMSCDPQSGQVFLPVTAPTHHFYGGFRHGDNLYGTSIVALDAGSGERQWHYQTVHHDIWDYDLPAAPIVMDIVVAGKSIPALAQVGKTGFVYVLDRRTGEPVWPIEERPVPASTLKGEQAAPTQPFPTWPLPFEMQGVSPADLVDFTPALREKVAGVVAGVQLGGLFTPATEQGTLMVPGIGGGANWGGAAYDPVARRLFVPSRRLPTILAAIPVDETRFGYPYMVRSTFPFVDGLPIVKPPWGSITAYDMDSGEIAWRAVNGSGPRDHPLLKGLELPDLGAVEAPGLLIAGDLLFYGHRGNAPAGESYLQARDKHSGELVFSHAVKGLHAQAPPMTYMAGGRQFVVIATGSSTEPARLTAFRLP
ncbi:MAG: PQQ-binding-like beta-propeller repeat protein [Pseudomonadota bacterium]